MNCIHSIGEFRKEEVDRKPFFIFSFLSQTYTQSSSSPEPLFICPSLRLNIQKLRNENAPHESFRFDTSPVFSSIGRSHDQQVQNMLDSHIHGRVHGRVCKHPVVPFIREEDDDDDEDEYEDDEEDEDEDEDEEDDDDDDEGDVPFVVVDDANPDFNCRACRREILVGTSYYLCDTCCKHFHKECVESPLEIKHPSHPFLSFHLHSVLPLGLDCILCKTSLSQNPMIYLSHDSILGMHPVCAMMPIPVVVNHTKRHLHSLTFFPKQAFLPCNVCGLIEKSFPTYVCLPCDFVVHQDCIYFPNVIRMSRHHHRISFTSSLPSGNWSCGVCRKKVDNHYGAYCCNKCDGYFVHSKCALREDLWDGEELEGVPEEPEIVVEPFKRIADGIIDHFSHGHHMKLETSRVYDEDKYCQACVLPIYEGNYYSCMDQCDFILHESCANAPCKKHHALHAHTLTLKVVNNGYNNKSGKFCCNACQRFSCGFVYECPEECEFRLDVRCALVSEPFEYQGHEHPLFLALNPSEENLAICQICRKARLRYEFPRKLNCTECDYIICFKCATLSYKAMYKHDKHFLTFQDGKEESDLSGWCEVCEEKIVHSRDNGFYSCDDYCCTTLHIDCLLGDDPYMKHGRTIKSSHDLKFRILPNKTACRPFCHQCKQHCRQKIVFKSRNTFIFCSLYCANLFLPLTSVNRFHLPL